MICSVSLSTLIGDPIPYHLIRRAVTRDCQLFMGIIGKEAAFQESKGNLSLLPF